MHPAEAPYCGLDSGGDAEEADIHCKWKDVDRQMTVRDAQHVAGLLLLPILRPESAEAPSEVLNRIHPFWVVIAIANCRITSCNDHAPTIRS
jgi:hypothetical protein